MRINNANNNSLGKQYMAVSCMYNICLGEV